MKQTMPSRKPKLQLLLTVLEIVQINIAQHLL